MLNNRGVCALPAAVHVVQESAVLAPSFTIHLLCFSSCSLVPFTQADFLLLSDEVLACPELMFQAV